MTNGKDDKDNTTSTTVKVDQIVSTTAAPLRRSHTTALTRVLWIIIIIILASGVVAGLIRGLKNKPNWGSLQRESRYVWEHHRSADNTAMFGYLPTTVFTLWPFMVWLPKWLGLPLYLTVNVLAAAAMAAWLVGVVCLGWHVMRWYGIHLAVLAILGAAVVWAWSRIAADNRGADPDAHRDSGATI